MHCVAVTGKTVAGGAICPPPVVRGLIQLSFNMYKRFERGRKCYRNDQHPSEILRAQKKLFSHEEESVLLLEQIVRLIAFLANLAAEQFPLSW